MLRKQRPLQIRVFEALQIPRGQDINSQVGLSTLRARRVASNAFLQRDSFAVPGFSFFSSPRAQVGFPYFPILCNSMPFMWHQRPAVHLYSLLESSDSSDCFSDSSSQEFQETRSVPALSSLPSHSIPSNQ